MDFTEGYLIDKEKETELAELIQELANKYKVHFDNKLNDFVVIFNLKFMETKQKEEYSNKYRRADTIIKFIELKGDSTIKTPTSSLDIEADFLKQLQKLLLEEVVSIYNSPILFGYSKKGKKVRIEKLAESERYEEMKPFREGLNAIVCWLKGMEIFSNKVQTIRYNEASFLYDLFYLMKHKLGYELSINWEEPPEIPSKAEKRSIILTYLKKNTKQID